jgi:putative copper export protein
LGVVIATGVGNLAHFGEALPEPRTEWGRELTLKLGLVLAFLVFSAVRTLAVTEAANRPETAPTRATERNLGTLYGITAASVGAILAVAVALAHF